MSDHFGPFGENTGEIYLVSLIVLFWAIDSTNCGMPHTEQSLLKCLQSKEFKA